jgi:SPP1 gp7 family putative phage head morphogenesis protein
MADIDSQIQDIYEGIVGGFLQRNDLLVQKATGRPTAAGIALLLTKKDEDAIAAIQKLTTQTAGVNFPEEVLGKAALVVKEVVLDKGLPPADAARRLENEIAGVLGIADAAVPSTFETNPEAYFEILANNAALMARNVGGLIAMENAKIQKYRISAILDRRTSAICRALDGRVFSVSAGMEMVNTVIGLDSAQELKETFPWSKWQSGKVGPDTPANNDKIATQGLGFPPYHGSCRSLVLPEF